MRKIFFGGLILAVLLGGALWGFVNYFGGSTATRHPALAETVPLKPASEVSTVFLPVAIAKKAILAALEPQAPRNLVGKREFPLSELLGKASVEWNIDRGPLATDGRSDALSIKTTLNGKVHVAGQGGNQIGQVGNLIGGSFGRSVGNLAGKPFDQKLDVNGDVTVTVKPKLKANWRTDPNLAVKVVLADRTIDISGFKFDVTKEVKPYLDQAVDQQMAKLGAQLRDDPTFEQTVRREWANMCRSISLGKPGPDMPALWVEIKPKRALAAQPRIEKDQVILNLGMYAETRVVSSETRPDCPFPAKLELIPATDIGKIAIAVPIDLPFTEVNRLLDAQLGGKTFPDKADAPVHVTVHKATLAASGDRLLIALKVKAKEEKSVFGLGADADVFVWGKPTLDDEAQLLRFTDLTLDVESESAFGLAGAAARAAVPYVQKTLEEQAVVDLKPMASTARKSIETAIADFQKTSDGMMVDATVTGVRLAAIEYDAKTLRVTAEVDANARVALTKLP